MIFTQLVRSHRHACNLGRRICVVAIALLAGTGRLRGAAAADYQQKLLTGDYEAVIKDAGAAAREAGGNPEAALALVRALLTVGKVTEADAALRGALERESTPSIRLRWLARDVAFANGRPDEAAQRIDEIRQLVTSRPWNFRTAADMVVVGRAFLAIGVDPKDVLEKILGAAQRLDPKLRDVFLAPGDLALEKHDYALAAKAYEEGLKLSPDDPDLLCGQAKAFENGEREVALKALASALKVNPRHIPSLLQMVDHRVDAEEYDQAEKILDQIIAINPVQPDAWAYRAVIAHLRNQPEAEKSAREHALGKWPQNPRVDYLIGRKLAQKYRFAEAAAYERRAHQFDQNYLPATAELATDLLRLGEEAEGWSLAHAVHDKDDYDVEAYNLVTLHDTMAKYAALSSDDFVVRMSTREVAIYGPRVLSLLRREQELLTQKYGVELAKPTFVEIFADQKDFAVRTFGLPDIPGFLGVCFGRVVTANSPATSASATNWESVLWHEFCHVVTLQLTRNKMPRWLSEGISVYEERQANPAWGMHIDPPYRDMLLGEDLVPVGKLSAAFLAPKTSKHLQFAYLESSLVVEFIVARYGIDHLRGILRDLREGAEINAALTRNTAPLAELEKQFTEYAHAQANAVAAKLDWTKPDPELLLPDATDRLAAWEKKHPDNYWLLRLRAGQAAEAQKWAEAKVPLQRLIELYPEQKGTDSAYRPLVAALRALGDAAGEREILKQWTAVDDEATDGYLRLMELASADKDWKTVALNADRYLAVNPLVAPPYRYQAEASNALGDASSAVVAWRTLLQLDPPNPAEAHFQLAKLLHARGDDGEARRQTLLALEDTPRYREALHLLVEFQRPAESANPTVPGQTSAMPAPDLPKKVLK